MSRRSLRVAIYNLEEGTTTLALPLPIHWYKCYLENTNLVSTLENEGYAVEITLNNATTDFWKINAGSGANSTKAISFIIARDDFNPLEKQMVENGNPSVPMHELVLTIEGLGGNAMDTLAGFLLLRFEVPS